MATRAVRNWTAHVVVSCEHEGLRPHFKALEDELYRVLARVDDPRQVREYIDMLRWRSREWFAIELDGQARK